MQSKSQIQQILSANGLRPNKKLGQNFLIDFNTLALFIDKADIARDDLILEVGPGTGSLTEELCERAGKVVAVEYDRGLAAIITDMARSRDNLTVIAGDVLKNQNAISPKLLNTIRALRAHCRGKFKLVSNLPYDISSPLIVNLLTGQVDIDQMYITVQREIAEKMIAEPNGKCYGTLSIFVQAAGRCRIFHKLSSGVFWPKPKVASAMVEYEKDNRLFNDIKDKDIFRTVVAMFFQHRRKTLRACTKFAPVRISSVPWPDIFDRLGIDSGKRPENLKPSDFVCIANAIAIL